MLKFLNCHCIAIIKFSGTLEETWKYIQFAFVLWWVWNLLFYVSVSWNHQIMIKACNDIIYFNYGHLSLPGKNREFKQCLTRVWCIQHGTDNPKCTRTQNYVMPMSLCLYSLMSYLFPCNIGLVKQTPPPTSLLEVPGVWIWQSSIDLH